MVVREKKRQSKQKSRFTLYCLIIITKLPEWWKFGISKLRTLSTDAVGRVLANGPEDRDLIQVRVIPKT